MTRSENFILDFTHIYIDENIEQTENIVRIDCSDILETDLYCTKEGEAEIQKRIENFSINGVHFIDSGNYHYITKIMTDKINKKFYKMLSHIQKYDILLASNSPRRRELLSGLGIEYQVTALPNIDESYPETLQGEEIPQYIATVKAEAYKPEMSDKTLLITADTIVWLNGKVFGKPKDKDDAKNMLRTLSGNIHTVITGVCITTQEKQISFAVSTDVSFATLDEEEIDFYVENYAPLDKAGAYGIQEWIGFVGVNGINGSYFNVMGLPIHRLYQELKHF